MRIHRQSCCLVSSPAHDQTTVGEGSRSHDAEAVSEKFRATATTSPRKTSASDQVGSHKTLRWRGESTANSSLKLGADSGRVMDDSGIVKRCFALEFRRKLSSLPWQPAPHCDN